MNIKLKCSHSKFNHVDFNLIINIFYGPLTRASQKFKPDALKLSDFKAIPL